MKDSNGLRSRVSAIERLTALFRVERFVYLGVTCVSFLLLMIVAVRMILAGKALMSEWVLLFGSTGLITITANRVLQMWSQSLRMIAAEAVDGTGGGK